ncbi:heparin-sulfate lyase HepC [Pedobacter nyackensis]|uniref:Heparan-sulfate lyase n=1 Tax=Pedobacter nyackensis TaxID=475255 RepID=A0A1W2E1C4_9SPHI|nr:heparin-sulfate lyase HepC [Pedobacter nyackensis]SMD03267.1 heparan-sulfate lyase [Pedobacter nyackensis]
MMNLKKIILLLTLAPTLLFAQQQSNRVSKDSFSNLNLNYPGLEEVNKLIAANDYENAAKALLKYYRKRDNIKHPDYNKEDQAKFAGKKLAEGVQEKADKGMLHQFYVHPGYGFIDYGKDINWQHWPIKDNEIRWQLHRTYWWQPMGLAYWASGDEKYAKEWIFQFRDWVKKNPKGLSKDNDRFAWRPLEVATRIQDQTGMFNMFVNSPNFTPDFLLEFLNIYNQQADHILNNYSDKGNHLLFEAQRIIYAGCFFPELKAAGTWRKSGIDILNSEIKKQIYPDGVHFELSPNYHVATINIFLKALRMTQLTGMSNEFPESYKKTIEEMIIALADFSFPDYAYPMFGDAKLAKKDEMVKQYKEWQEVYPTNQVIKYFATEGKQGTAPAYLSSALKTGGFYTFRNGWKENATVMVLKASPPAFFHSQPDNGTFDLWVNGRNFMPDAGAYVYSGSEEIQKLREAYRQTKVHKTLTLDNNNMDINNAKLMTWKASPAVDLLVYSNPSYKDLNHRRSVLFIDKKYFVIIDEAVGAAKGNVGIHFQLAEKSNAAFNKNQNSVQTQYKDGNNLLIQTLGKGATLTEEEGKVSYSYRKEVARPAFVFEKAKNTDNTVSFTTVLYPYEGAKAPVINVKEGSKHNLAKGIVDLTLTIDGKKRQISEQLY